MTTQNPKCPKCGRPMVRGLDKNAQVRTYQCRYHSVYTHVPVGEVSSDITKNFDQVECPSCGGIRAVGSLTKQETPLRFNFLLRTVVAVCPTCAKMAGMFEGLLAKLEVRA